MNRIQIKMEDGTVSQLIMNQLKPTYEQFSKHRAAWKDLKEEAREEV